MRLSPRRLVLYFILSGWLTACTFGPDLSYVDSSLSAGAVGRGATAPSLTLLRTSFGQRVKQAVENNPSLAESESRYKRANATEEAARGAFLPQVNLGLSARSQRSDSDLANFTPYVRISQLVYDGGVASSELTAAKARVLESRGDQLQTGSAIALAAIEAYVSVLSRREIFDISVRNVEVHEDILHQITERSSLGAGSTADVMAARSRMADAQTRLADARARIDRAEAQFRDIFGQQAGDLSKPAKAPKLTRTDTEIVVNSPQVRRADAALLAAKADLTAALARRRPGVELAAFADRDDDDDTDFGIDLSVNYELDSTGQRRASISAAEARVSEAEFARETLIRDIRRELDFIRSDQQAGAKRLQAAKIAAKANEDSVEAARAQFTIGRRSLIEILDAQRDYVNAQERLILADQNFFLTNYAALSLTGDILDLLGLEVVTQGARQ